MRQIGLAVILTIDLVLAPLAAEAQQPGKVYRIGVLSTGSPPRGNSPTADAFRQGLRDFGYVEGQNIAIEWRWTYGGPERLPDIAAELVRQS